MRRFDGTTFAAPVTITDSADPSATDLVQDVDGRLHAVFTRLSGSGLHLLHATSDDGISPGNRARS